jgi:hypothetical protein
MKKIKVIIEYDQTFNTYQFRFRIGRTHIGSRPYQDKYYCKRALIRFTECLHKQYGEDKFKRNQLHWDIIYQTKSTF